MAVFQRFSSFTGCTFNILTQPALISGLPTVLTVIFVTITHAAQLNDHIKGVFLNLIGGRKRLHKLTSLAAWKEYTGWGRIFWVKLIANNQFITMPSEFWRKLFLKSFFMYVVFFLQRPTLYINIKKKKKSQKFQLFNSRNI